MIREIYFPNHTNIVERITHMSQSPQGTENNSGQLTKLKGAGSASSFLQPIPVVINFQIIHPLLIR
jgi:hypothetical protein